jgi:RimJ/RimL family protein N-acetyltransferase
MTSLRDVTDADLPTLYEQQLDADAVQMAAVPPRDWSAFAAHWAKIRRDDTGVVRTILHGDRVAGNVVSWESDGKRLVGYWIGREFWGKGIATAAVAEFLKAVEVRPLFAHVAKHNLASIRVLEKCGFVVDADTTEALPPPSDGVEEFVFKLA